MFSARYALNIGNLFRLIFVFKEFNRPTVMFTFFVRLKNGIIELSLFLLSIWVPVTHFSG